MFDLKEGMSQDFSGITIIVVFRVDRWNEKTLSGHYKRPILSISYALQT